MLAEAPARAQGQKMRAALRAGKITAPREYASLTILAEPFIIGAVTWRELERPWQ